MHGVHGSGEGLPERDKEALSAGRYGMPIAIMREMGWSWQELGSAPFDLVQELVIRLNAENEWQEMKRTQGVKP
jgi:hypothetical protein